MEQCRSRGNYIHPMFEQPPKWITRFLDQSNCENCPNEEDLRPFRATVLIPIHNEGRMLPSHLGALHMAKVPPNAEVHFLYAVNNCTDNGLTLKHLKDFFSQFERVEIVPFGHDTSDTELDKFALIAMDGQKKHILIHTKTPGKSNVMEIANKYAVNQGHPYVINIDANNWVEQDTLLQLLSDCEAAFNSESQRYVILSAKNTYAIKEKGSIRNNHNRTVNSQLHVASPHHPGDVHGECMAWSTSWMAKLPKVPRQSCIDYSLGLIARAQGFQIGYSDATVWGYAQTKLSDRIETVVRLTRGNLQLFDYISKHTPDLEKPVREKLEIERPHFRSRTRRWLDSWSHIIQRPRDCYKYVRRQLFYEYVNLMAAKQYRDNPNNASWRPLSTK